MTDELRVDVWYSLQSDYCYFLLDRLLWLERREVHVVIRPVLGLVLRMPEATRNRSEVELQYFRADAQRTAAYLGLPYAYPDPSPIQFVPGAVWVAAERQPYDERLYRLFVGANRLRKGLAFLDKVGRGLWNGRNPAWDRSDFLSAAMADIGLDRDEVLRGADWRSVSEELESNHRAMLAVGHWGVPLMAFRGEPFYGQDRFDQLLWRMGLDAP